MEINGIVLGLVWIFDAAWMSSVRAGSGAAVAAVLTTWLQPFQRRAQEANNLMVTGGCFIV